MKCKGCQSIINIFYELVRVGRSGYELAGVPCQMGPVEEQHLSEVLSMLIPPALHASVQLAA